MHIWAYVIMHEEMAHIPVAKFPFLVAEFLSLSVEQISFLSRGSSDFIPLLSLSVEPPKGSLSVEQISFQFTSFFLTYLRGK